MNKCDRYECDNCRDCFYSYVSQRSGTAANSIDYINCKRYPEETRHRPYDWCGEWKSDKN